MHISQLMVIGVAAIGCALALAACGASAGYNPAAATNPNSSTGPLALSQCMHSHGIKNFPDPSNGGLSLATSPGTDTVMADGITFSGPAFESGVKSCKFFGGGTGPPPISGAQQEQMIAKARCIRTHGVPNFPDPTFGPGGEGVGINLAPGDNPQGPAVRRAARACAHVGTNIPGVGLG